MTTSAQVVPLLTATSGVAFLIMLAGVQKNALEWRRRKRSCPSCGHRIAGRTCGCT